ncbi:hypothetical protein GCM10009416_35740 [Craurococcus roseus]|uniref:Uncharacterized protein n=1 Tax=Craurococcus roseus TaxID=77585 RepID=A0ABP3QU28_9PROT
MVVFPLRRGACRSRVPLARWPCCRFAAAPLATAAPVALARGPRLKRRLPSPERPGRDDTASAAKHPTRFDPGGGSCEQPDAARARLVGARAARREPDRAGLFGALTFE